MVSSRPAVPPSARWVLPGLRSIERHSFVKHALSFAYYQSYACNPRNLEHRSYGAWCDTLFNLICDLRHIIVIPQHLLDFTPVDDMDGIVDAASEASTKPSNQSFASQDDIFGEESGGLGETSFSTAYSNTLTVPNSAARGIIPDFALVHLVFRRRSLAHTLSRDNVKIRNNGVPLLVEVKRLAKRTADNTKDIEVAIFKARTALYKQAAYLFCSHPLQQSVVLVAAAGNWWSCRIMKREDAMDYLDVELEADDDDEYRPEDHDDGKEDETARDATDDELDELDVMFLDTEMEDEEGGEDDRDSIVEAICPESDLKLPDLDWTLCMKMQTGASNQKWYEIHNHLGRVMDDRTGTMG